jgi:cation:H+ antiporter
MHVTQLVGGGLLLYLGAEWFVAGASGLAVALRLSKLVIGLTIVAYGTSAPELVVSLQAALERHGQVALGNVIGSNIANFALILGLSALQGPIHVDAVVRRRELPALLLASAALIIALADGVLVPLESWVLLSGAAAYTLWMFRSVRGKRHEREALEAAAGAAEAARVAGAPGPGRGRTRFAATALVGLAFLLTGGSLFVDAAASLAEAWGMSERVVGLTIVAIGTSLPELVTSLIATRRGHADLVVGNVVGSNIFNILLCLGVAGTLGAIRAAGPGLVLDLVVLAMVTGATSFFMRTERTISRLEGAALLGTYCTYMAFLLAQRNG